MLCFPCDVVFSNIYEVCSSSRFEYFRNLFLLDCTKYSILYNVFLSPEHKFVSQDHKEFIRCFKSYECQQRFCNSFCSIARVKEHTRLCTLYVMDMWNKFFRICNQFHILNSFFFGFIEYLSNNLFSRIRLAIFKDCTYSTSMFTGNRIQWSAKKSNSRYLQVPNST